VALSLWPVRMRNAECGMKMMREIFRIPHSAFRTRSIPHSPGGFLYTVGLLYVALHVLVISALSGLGPISLHEWGQRYLLPAYPLLVVASLQAVYQILGSVRGPLLRKIAIASVALWTALAIVGIGFTARGYVVLSEERTQVA